MNAGVRRAVLVSLALLVAAGPARAANIPSDGSFGTWDGTTYTLNQDLSESINIDADNFTLDGAGFAVTGTGAASGVYLIGRSGVTVTDLTVQSWGNGIYLRDSSGNTLSGNRISGNSWMGMQLVGAASDNIIQGNTVSGNNTGIDAYSSTGTGNQYVGNDLSNSASWSLRIANDTQLRATGNTFTNSRSGVYLKNMDNVELTGADFDLSTVQGGIAIQLHDVTNATVRDITTSARGGLSIFGGGGHQITNFTASRSGLSSGVQGFQLNNTSNNTIRNASVANYIYGIYLQLDSDGNIVEGLELSEIVQWGVWILATSDGNTFRQVSLLDGTSTGYWDQSEGGNALTGSTFRNCHYGIRLEGSSGNTVTGNTVTGSTHTAIQLYDSTSDNLIQGNAVTGNVIGLDASGSSGTGNRYLDNDLSHNTNWALKIANDTQLQATGNTFTNSVYGVYLKNMDNVELTGADFDLSTVQGGIAIQLHDVTNATVRDITTSARGGLSIFGGGGHQITNFTASRSGLSSGVQGFQLNNTSNNTIRNASVANYIYGIYLQLDSDGNIVEGLELSEIVQWGVWILATSDGNTFRQVSLLDGTSTGYWDQSEGGNALTGSTFRNCHYGIRLEGSSGNTVTGNTVTGSTHTAIQLYDNASDNQVYNNRFADNNRQAHVVGGSANLFNLDRPVGGNHWSNWTTPDADQDGFVDNPFVFTGGQDNLPWADPDGWSNRPPVADAGPDASAECACSEGAQLTLDGTGSSDPDRDELTFLWEAEGITFDNPEGPTPTAIFPLGTTAVTLTVTDPKGEESADEVTIAVADATAPEIALVLEPDELWPPNHKLVDIAAAVAASDICDPQPSVVLAAVESDEPDEGLGDGDHPGDIQDVDLGTPDYQFRLRAEHSGKGDGREYTVTYSVTDESGNSATVSSVVVVPHDRGGKGRKKEVAAALPSDYALRPSAPNPFNAATVIGFDLPAPEYVRLEVFDVLGHRVRLLVSAPIGAGSHRVSWDGRDDTGRALSSGIYLYRLEAGDFGAVERMLLVR